MKQKDIYYANLYPSGKGKKTMPPPVVIISGNTMNEHLGMCIVCPISKKVNNYAGCVVLKKDKKNKLKQDSEIITFQITTLAKDRLIKKIGEITNEQLYAVYEGLSDVLKW